MTKPEISENFTIEDIHKIREYNAERRKKLSLEERLKDIKDSADKCEKDIEIYRKNKMAI
ncbi:MAG: hypothetical protein J6M02_02375 [Clostridia bacterium]|nr:hypothetical protein [Clostridia bacterium]